MFASDETHLTSFGDAQIWPVYMHFGNESKYRRGKASLKLFEEVAYFQKVRLYLVVCIPFLKSITIRSCQTPLATGTFSYPEETPYQRMC